MGQTHRSANFWREHGLTLVVALLGIALTLGFTYYARLRELERSHKELERRSADLILTLNVGLQIPLEVLRSLPPLLSTHPNLDRDRFRAFVSPSIQRHPPVAALEWAPAVSSADRLAFETEVQRSRPDFEIREPDNTGTMARSPDRPLHFPLLYMEPEAAPVLGLDLSFEPQRQAALERAIASGDVATSERFRLVEDPPDVHSVAFYAPAFKPGLPTDTPEARRAALLGVAVEVVRLGPSVTRTLEDIPLAPLELTILDLDAASENVLLYESRPGLALEPTGHRFVFERPVPAGDRRWSVRFTAPHETFSLGTWLVLLVGLILTAAASAGATAYGSLRNLKQQVKEALQLGQYTLVRKIGQGGMGAVYHARHAMLRRPTAIKLLSGVHGNDEQLVRFEREVRYNSQLTHPNTVAVFDYGRTPDGVLYYAMEYLEGINLQDLVQQYGLLSDGRALYLLTQAAGALAEAHQRGVVHRDVKPANLMLTERGGIPDFVKVLDFGLVKPMATDEKTVSRAGFMLGTPLYMAPEAITNPVAVGPTIDVYALGCVAYYLMVGIPPFVAATIPEICQLQINAAPPPPSSRTRIKIAPEFEALILRCLAKDPADRFADGAELRDALELIQPINAWTPAQARLWWREHGVRFKAKDQPEQPNQTLAIDVAKRRAGATES